jgi:archaellum component FlaC
VQALDRSIDEKINIIAQTIEGYMQEIEELKEKINPMTPLEVREKREWQASFQIDEMAREVREITKLFDETMQIWTTLEEDEKVQQLDQQKEKISDAMQELKQG